MLLSMTGFGEARLQDERWSVGVEVRTVNNRHLKMSAGSATRMERWSLSWNGSSARRSGAGWSRSSSGWSARDGRRTTG